MQSTAEVHIQHLVALALVGLLHMCADTYVSAELAANGPAAAQHARHLSNVLMRLRASVNPNTLPELSSDLQVEIACPLPTQCSALKAHHSSSSEAICCGCPCELAEIA